MLKLKGSFLRPFYYLFPMISQLHDLNTFHNLKILIIIKMNLSKCVFMFNLFYYNLAYIILCNFHKYLKLILNYLQLSTKKMIQIM